MCGGGGGGGGETRYNWNSSLQPKWDRLLGDSEYVAYKNAYEPYGGQRIADLNYDHANAMNTMRGMFTSGGPQASIAARNQAEHTLNDKYLTGDRANPYAGAANAYQGINNPYFRDTVLQGLGDIGDTFHSATADNLARFRGDNRNSSAFDGATARNESALAKNLGNFTKGMLNDQYTRSAAMDESRLNRGASAYEGERGRQVGAIGAGQNEQDQFFKAAQQWMGLGDINRSMHQDYLNMNYQNWLDQKNQEFKNADWLSGIYSRAQGGMSPNSTSQVTPYQASPFSQLLGAGLLGYGMTR